MRALVRENVTLVWLALVLATCLSWWLGTDHGTSHTVATIGVIVVAFVKVRFIGIHFMELGRAPLPLRLLFEGYALVVPVVLICLYLAM